eukprot:jgi/Mesvir1/6908/Mv09065-RA.2
MRWFYFCWDYCVFPMPGVCRAPTSDCSLLSACGNALSARSFGLAPGDHCWQLAILWGSYLALCGPMMMLSVWLQQREVQQGHGKGGRGAWSVRHWRLFLHKGVGPLAATLQLSCLALVLGTYMHHRECRHVAPFFDSDGGNKEFAHCSYLEAVVTILFCQLFWPVLRRPLIWVAVVATMFALLIALPALSGAKYESWEELYAEADYQRSIFTFVVLAAALWLLCRRKAAAPPHASSSLTTPRETPSTQDLGHPLSMMDHSHAGGTLGTVSRTHSWNLLQQEAREMMRYGASGHGGGQATGSNGGDTSGHGTYAGDKQGSGRDALRRLFMAERRLAKTPMETVSMLLASVEAGSVPLSPDVVRFLQELLAMDLHLPMGIQLARPPHGAPGSPPTMEVVGARAGNYRRIPSLRRENSMGKGAGEGNGGHGVCGGGGADIVGSPEGRRRRTALESDVDQWLPNSTLTQVSDALRVIDVDAALEADLESSGHSRHSGDESHVPRGRRVRELGAASLDLNALFLAQGSALKPIPNALEDYNTENIRRMLSKAGTWNFEVVELAASTGNRPLSAIGYVLLRNLDLISRFSLDEGKLLAFLRHMDKVALPNPYHSNVHMADVTSNLYFMLQSSGLIKLMMPIDVLACMLGALIHDYNHPGVNNDFLRRSHNHLSLLYNDKSPLENHHLTQAYLLLQRPEFNFMCNMREEEVTAVRHVVIETVLSSDLKRHFELLDLLKARQRFFRPWVAAHDPRGLITGINTPPPSDTGTPGEGDSESRRISANSLTGPLKEQDRLLLMQFALKVADIGHSAKYRSLHLHWCRAIMEEFYLQGDKEKALGLPVSPFMDRDSANVPKSQLGFYEYIVLPMYETFAYIFPKTSLLVDAAVVNRSFWASLVDAGIKDIPSKVN